MNKLINFKNKNIENLHKSRFYIVKIFNYYIKFIERLKIRSKYLVLGPGARKNLSVIESYTTDTF